jgi:type IV pilus assembly protein PilA
VNSWLIRSSGAAFVLFFAGCVKKPESGSQTEAAQVKLVAEDERSSHFDAVNANLELGGTLYGYVDVDGDALDAADAMHAAIRQMALAQPQLAKLEKQDLKALFTDLGLNDVRAIGLSSVRGPNGSYRNRTFIYTPGGRHGLLAIFGGQPAKFDGARLAPPDADFYSECEFDIRALYDTVKGVIAKVGGPEQAASFENSLKGAGQHSGFSALEILRGLKGRLTIVIKMDPQVSLTLPTGANPLKIPALFVFVKVTGIGAVLEKALENGAVFAASSDSGRHLFMPLKPSPVAGIQPVFETEGETLYFATSTGFLQECLNRQKGLDTNPQFAAGLAALGPDGNGLTWVAPRFFEGLKEIPTLNPNAPPQMMRAFDLLAANLPTPTQPLFSVRSNLPEGILVRSNWNRSLKADIAMFSIYNPVTVGLMAAMAIPAFQKVRQNSRVNQAYTPPSLPSILPGAPQTASQTSAMADNLNVLDQAAQRYYAEHNTTTTTLDQLVGPGKYIPSINSVAGEDYRTVLFKKGRPLRLFLKDGRIVIFPPQ